MEVSGVVYGNLFAALCRHMGHQRPERTGDITREIKRFFRQHYQRPHHVHCFHESGSEYMTDVLVTSFDPKRLVEDRTLKIVPSSVDAYLAVESELGGVGASSAYGVMKNVVEDYAKLLLMRARYRVMIFTSLPYTKEQDHVENRVETLRDLYCRAHGLTSGVLLVHLEGTQPRSTQVQASFGNGKARGFLISEDGLSVEDLGANQSEIAA
jgi:hypothetical protein